MNQSDSIAALAASLAKAQGVMEGAKKDSTNPFFKSSYSDLSSVWDACRKPLADNGLSVVQTSEFMPDHPDMVCIETTLCHSSGEWMRGKLAVKPVKPDPQSVGSCITYLRRYSLQSMVGIAPEDDDGNAASGQGAKKSIPPARPKTPPPNTETDVSDYALPEEPSLDTKSSLHKKIEALISEAGNDREIFKEWLGCISWIKEKDGRLSLSTLSEKNAKSLVDKWDSAQKTFNAYVDAGNQPGKG